MKPVVNIIPFVDFEGFYIKEKVKSISEGNDRGTKDITVFNIKLKTKIKYEDFIFDKEFRDYDKAKSYIMKLNDFTNKYKKEKIILVPNDIKEGVIERDFVTEEDEESNLNEIEKEQLKKLIGFEKTKNQSLLLKQNNKSRKSVGFFFLLISFPMFMTTFFDGTVYYSIVPLLFTCISLLIILYFDEIEFTNEKVIFKKGVLFFKKEESINFNNSGDVIHSYNVVIKLKNEEVIDKHFSYNKDKKITLLTEKYCNLWLEDKKR
jgi:hypothetical protein